MDTNLIGIGAPIVATIYPETNGAYKGLQAGLSVINDLPEGIRDSKVVKSVLNAFSGPALSSGPGSDEYFNGWTYNGGKNVSPVTSVSYEGNTRHFTFVLYDSFSGSERIKNVTLNINPEDLSIEQPYRVSATQTMGGAFLDIWGKTFGRITMRGNTGWRKTKIATQLEDGLHNLMSLKEDVFERYFAARTENESTYTADALQEKIQIHVIDKLHQKVYYVIPEYCKIYRSRSKPLLHMYEVSFIYYDTLKPYTGNDAVAPAHTFSLPQAKNFWGKFGTLVNDASKLMTLSGNSTLERISTPLAGVGAFMNEGLSLQSNISFKGLSQAVSKTMHSLASGIGVVQSSSIGKNMDVQSQMAMMDAKQAIKDASLFAAISQTNKTTSYTNVVGSGDTSLSFLPKSPLESAANSFSTILKSNSNTGINEAISGLNVNNTVAAKALNSVDPVLAMVKL